MDAETRDRLESWAANLARLSLHDRKFSAEHARNAADLRATLAEIDRLAVAERERDAILAHTIHDDPEAGGWFYLDFWVKTFEDDDGGSEYVPMTSWIDNREGGRESAIKAVRKAAGLED